MHQNTVTEILSYIDDQEVIRYAQDLVRIESVNPNLDCSAGEEQLVDYLASSFRREGLQVRIEEVAPRRSNIYCELPGEEEGIGLAFLGHTDTVPLLGMKNALSGKIKGDHIWGRGSVDMKGGLAASVQALITLVRSNVRLKKGVAIWAVIDEESEHQGAFSLKGDGLEADYCIVTEPSDSQLVLGCKGTCPVRIDIEGVLAHGSEPWRGVNAIRKAAQVITALDQLQLQEANLDDLNEPVRGSINIGVIEGGTQYNNVADSCALYLDRRMVPGETQATCLREIQELLLEMASEDQELRAAAQISRPDWSWEPIIERGLNPAYTPLSNPVAQAVQESHFAIKKENVPIQYSNGYYDMDFAVNDLGIPTVCYGPGEEKYCHAANEQLHIGQLLDATRVYLHTALQLLI